MNDLILNTPSLTKFIVDTPMEEAQRKELLDDLAYMDREQRIELFRTLLAIQELEHEKQQAIQKVEGSKSS